GQILGRVYEEIRHDPTPGGTNLVTRFGYDANGNQTQRIVNPGGANLTWSTAYDKRGRVISETDPNNVVTTYTYDAADRVLQTSVNSDSNPSTNGEGEAVTENVYDPAGRLSQV